MKELAPWIAAGLAAAALILGAVPLFGSLGGLPYEVTSEQVDRESDPPFFQVDHSEGFFLHSITGVYHEREVSRVIYLQGAPTWSNRTEATDLSWGDYSDLGGAGGGMVLTGTIFLYAGLLAAVGAGGVMVMQKLKLGRHQWFAVGATGGCFLFFLLTALFLTIGAHQAAAQPADPVTFLGVDANFNNTFAFGERLGQSAATTIWMPLLPAGGAGAMAFLDRMWFMKGEAARKKAEAEAAAAAPVPPPVQPPPT